MKRKEAFFGLHLDLHPTEQDVALGADVTEKNIEKLIDRVKPDHIAYDCKGHEGYSGYPTKVGVSAPNIIKDSLAIYRKVTREKGVLLGIHYSGVVDIKATLDHPEWQALKADGTSDHWATSTFGDYVDERMIPQLKEVIELYDVDSVWLDGECWGTQLDYSDMAISQWTKITGHIEVPKSKEDPLWLEWKNFHRDNFLKYVKHWTESIHSVNSTVEVASNWLHTTFCPVESINAVDFISGDFDPCLSVDRARFEVRFLNHMNIPWELQSWGFDAGLGFNLGANEEYKLPTQLMQEAGVVLAHGGGYMLYFLPTRSGYLNDTIINTAGIVADFCRERQELCHKNTYVPQVCLLYCAETYADRSDNVYTWWDCKVKELEGVLHSLLENHYSVDVLTEFMLTTEKMAEFPLIVIPDSYKLTSEFIEKITKYVENGGNVLLFGGNCCKLFEKQLGVSFEGECSDSNCVIKDKYENKMPTPGKWQEIKPVEAEVLFYKYNGTGKQNRSSYMDTRDEGVSKEHSLYVTKSPAITVRKLGKGKIAGIYGELSLNYYNSHHPFLRSIISSVVNELFSEPLFETNAPYCVDFSLRKARNGNLTLHLLNLSNLPVAPQRAFCDYVPPIFDINVKIKCENRPTKVLWQPSGEILDYNWNNGVLNVDINRLDIHGAIEIIL